MLFEGNRKRKKKKESVRRPHNYPDSHHLRLHIAIWMENFFIWLNCVGHIVWFHGMAWHSPFILFCWEIVIANDYIMYLEKCAWTVTHLPIFCILHFIYYFLFILGCCCCCYFWVICGDERVRQNRHIITTIHMKIMIKRVRERESMGVGALSSNVVYSIHSKKKK